MLYFEWQLSIEVRGTHLAATGNAAAPAPIMTTSKAVFAKESAAEVIGMIAKLMVVNKRHWHT